MVACAADEMTSSELLNPRPDARPMMSKQPSRTSSVASNQSFPFRLSGEHHVNSHPSNRERAASIVSSDQQSIYKQRIDSMFDDSRSTTYGQTGANNRRANFVQAKIEQMFQEIASSSEEEHVNNNNNNSNRTRNNSQISSSIESSIENNVETKSNQSFNVHYLGNVPLIDKDTTLLNLQIPLKLLYFKYRELELKNCKPSLSKLQISSDGLKVIQGARSELNPFSTIAVWAAVKCVSRLEGKKLAFLPLIADPDGQDKSSLFTDLNSENDVNLANGSHSPLLAVVMRQHGSAKQLNCHVYVCTCSEDAIVMAANLYQALMASMKSKPLPQKSTEKPIRPPRKPKSKTSSEDDEILPEPDTNKLYLTHQRRVSTSNKVKDPSGDILTKVAIPRSRSFLMKHTARGNSLHQLFAEIRSQEGVTNMDDVLEKIVNANGMSFNDLKPLYKELLLKLAVTLTRDELYMRSKNIMKRQQKSSKRNSRKRKTGFKYVFRKSVKKIHGKVSCQNKQPSSFEFTSILFPAKKCVGPRTSSSTYSSYRTLQRKGMKDIRARKHKEAVESRLTNIANRELRRSSIAKEIKKSEAQAKRESSSGYVSCSDCSLNSCLCDTDSCTETDKCYCSLQNNKKQVVTSTSWRHHLNKPPSTHTSRSLQLLLQQPITSTKRRPSSYTSRMDVYDELPPVRRNSMSVSHRTSNNKNSNITTTPKFSSVDNLALDYELFRYNSKQNSVYSTSSQQRVLVVSARDNRGRLIYMGAAEKDKRKIYRDPAHEALAVKKSAEIASLFSDMKLSQTTDIRGIEFEDDSNVEPEVEYNTLEPPEHPSMNRRGSYPGSSLENSLGYLP